MAISSKRVVAGVSAFALLVVSPLAGAAPVAHYSTSGVGSIGSANAGLLGAFDVTTSSVAIELTIDYTPTFTAAASTNPVILFDAGGSGTGATVVIEGSQLYFWAGNSADDVVFGAHGLSATQTDVQIVAVFELNSGTVTATDELLSLYVNGGLVNTADANTANDWAGGELGTELGQKSNTTRANGTALISEGSIVSYPETNIDLAIYQLASSGGNVDNTLENILVPEPSSLALLGLGGLMVMRRRR